VTDVAPSDYLLLAEIELGLGMWIQMQMWMWMWMRCAGAAKVASLGMATASWWRLQVQLRQIVVKALAMEPLDTQPHPHPCVSTSIQLVISNFHSPANDDDDDDVPPAHILSSFFMWENLSPLQKINKKQ